MQGDIVTLPDIDKFVDGASVARVGDITFEIAKSFVHDYVQVDEGAVCSTILDMYSKQAIIAEPAGALSVAALEDYRELIKGKTVVCIVSGGNNDINRMKEIEERSPLKRNVDQEEVGKTAVCLLSDLSSGVTGENIHVDSGFHAIK